MAGSPGADQPAAGVEATISASSVEEGTGLCTMVPSSCGRIASRTPMPCTGPGLICTCYLSKDP